MLFGVVVVSAIVFAVLLNVYDMRKGVISDKDFRQKYEFDIQFLMEDGKERRFCLYSSYPYNDVWSMMRKYSSGNMWRHDVVLKEDEFFYVVLWQGKEVIFKKEAVRSVEFLRKKRSRRFLREVV